jgi:hypothetical protein
MRLVMPLREVPPDPGAVYLRPAVAFEVRSSDDETFDKLPFYAAVGVRAVVIVERDTNTVQVLTLAGEGFALEVTAGVAFD